MLAAMIIKLQLINTSRCVGASNVRRLCAPFEPFNRTMFSSIKMQSNDSPRSTTRATASSPSSPAVSEARTPTT